MYCPQCGQERISVETSFCSRCGFLLTGAAELLQSGGVMPAALQVAVSKRPTARNRGLKQGLFIFLLTFLVVPIVSILTVAINAKPFGVAIAAILLFCGGLLRMAYALMFESNEPGSLTFEDKVMESSSAHRVNGMHGQSALPPPTSIPAQAYISPAAGSWRDTNDLQPQSITESTTKLLEKDQ
ncbi:MAG: zinc ribbon domain-containing protein [Pyrinomonadaceae bacterium]|nr:zinc ribbon domain-containing protein [Pyrinomonadaceae bacterium]MBP6213528.1 zinc ribbon domain-containing protein [Pyrinomonadaceae bacterium]